MGAFFIYSRIFINMKLINIYETVLTENDLNGKNLIVVDVQPEYQNGPYGFGDVEKFVSFINDNADTFNSITFLFNGPDLGMISESELTHWWYENGLDEDIINMAIFYDKGYAFFRECMDSDIEYEEITLLVKFMYENDINDSRELTDEWENFKEFANVHGIDVEDIVEFLSDSYSTLQIPDLMDFLENYHNIVLIGGGVNECLAEVEIALDALDKDYITLSKYTY